MDTLDELNDAVGELAALCTRLLQLPDEQLTIEKLLQLITGNPAPLLCTGPDIRLDNALARVEQSFQT